MLLMLVAGLAVAAPVPPPFKAEYLVKRGLLTIGRMTREFSILPDGSYRFKSETTTARLASLLRKEHIVESSEGLITDDALVPRRYAYARAGHKPQRVDMVFAADGSINGSSGANQWHLDAAPPGTLDKLAYQVALMIDLRREVRTLRYAVADTGVTKEYVLDFVGEDQVQTPAGTYRTVKFERLKARSQRKTTFWSAADLGFLPVRVDYREKDGAVATAILNAVTMPAHQDSDSSAEVNPATTRDAITVWR